MGKLKRTTRASTYNASSTYGIATTYTYTDSSANFAPITPANFKVVPPPYEDFGNSYEILMSTMTFDPVVVQSTYGSILRDFFKVKQEHFPDWNGVPDITTTSGINPNAIQIRWSARVPREHITGAEESEENDLWES